jgi:protein involved in plasmid replication-relaxation
MALIEGFSRPPIECTPPAWSPPREGELSTSEGTPRGRELQRLCQTFPRADLARLVALASRLRLLALLSALRFIAVVDLERVGIDQEEIDAARATGALLSFQFHRRLTDPVPTEVLALSHVGALHLARDLGFDPDTVSYSTPSRSRRSSMFLDHTLARNAFALLLAAALASQSPAELLSFEHEAERLADAVLMLERPGFLERRPLVADALAVLQGPRGTEGLLVEIDRGTERPSYLGHKYAGYLQWWRSGGPERRFGLAALRLLTVAPDEKRTRQLHQVCREETRGRASGLFWFASEDALKKEGILSPVWSTARQENVRLWP